MLKFNSVHLFSSPLLLTQIFSFAGLFSNVKMLFFFFYIQVQGLIKKLVEEHFKSDMEAVVADPILFGDYSNALAETEPRVYEDILDYEASKILFQVPQVICCESKRPEQPDIQTTPPHGI